MELACDRLDRNVSDDMACEKSSGGVLYLSLDETSVSSASQCNHREANEPQRGDGCDDLDQSNDYVRPYCDPCCFNSDRRRDAVYGAVRTNDLDSVKSSSTVDMAWLSRNSVTPNDVWKTTTNNTDDKNDNRDDLASKSGHEPTDENELALYCNSVEAASEPSLLTLPSPSLFDQLDIWFEKLCFTSSTDDSSFLQSRTNDTYWLSMESIMTSLGSCNAPMMEELEQWGTYESLLESQVLFCCNPTVVPATHPSVPVAFGRRGSARKRRVLEQLLRERGRGKSSLAQYQLRKTKSFSAVHDAILKQQRARRSSKERAVDFWEYWLVGGTTPSALDRTVPSDNDDGYDSDPDLPYTIKSHPHRAESPQSIMALDGNSNLCMADAALMHRTVEETMNTTWNLCWIRNDKPVQVQIWIERGTLIQKNWAMVEPRLMWRPLGSNIPESSIRLLQVCRIQEGSRITTSIPKMCRASTSFLVRTIQKEVFWFQAATAMERDAIVLEWKLAIARLATLAVLEDSKPLLKEFFLAKEKEYY